MRRLSPLAGLAVVLCLGGLALAPPLFAQSPLNVRMQKVLGKFVEATGYPVMGVGSWISGTNFSPTTSDFDMRLVWPGGGTEAQQLAHWQKARGQMINLIREEFGDQAGNILNRTNLYAPNQLMKGRTWPTPGRSPLRPPPSTARDSTAPARRPTSRATRRAPGSCSTTTTASA